MSGEIEYQLEPDLPLDEFIGVLERSTLGRHRPLTNQPVMAGMLRHADLLMTARHAGLLVGVSRAITDFSFCTYLADLAVDTQYQRQGIGQELLHRIHESAGRHTLLILLAAPEADSYYPHIGLDRHESCWIVPRELPRE